MKLSIFTIVYQNYTLALMLYTTLPCLVCSGQLMHCEFQLIGTGETANKVLKKEKRKVK